MNEMEERAVMAKAYPPPSMAETESALGLVRFRLPSRRPRNWLGGLMKIAAALVVLAGTFTAGVYTASLRNRPGEDAETGYGANGYGLLPARLDRAPGTTAPPFRPGASMSVPGAMRTISGFHIQVWEVLTTGARRMTIERTLLAADNPRFRISKTTRGDLSLYGRINVEADFTAHAFDDRVSLAAQIFSRFPEQIRANPVTQSNQVRFNESTKRQQLLLAPGEPGWFYLNGEPRQGQRNVAIAILPVLAQAGQASHGVTRSSVTIPTGFGDVLFEAEPGIQGAHFRIDVGDGATWTTVFDRSRLALTAVGQVLDIPGLPSPGNRIIFELSPLPSGEPKQLCFSFAWSERRAPGGGRCLDRDAWFRGPITIPLYGSAGKQLRLTLLDTF